MADSTPEQMNENLASIQELRIALGTDRMATLPIIVSLNKRDLPNALPIDYMVQMLDLEGHPVFDTIATQGKNLLTHVYLHCGTGFQQPVLWTGSRPVPHSL